MATIHTRHSPRVRSEMRKLRFAWPQAGFYVISTPGIIPAVVRSVDAINGLHIAVSIAEDGTSQAHGAGDGGAFNVSGASCASAEEAVKSVLNNACEVVK